jgi:phospholipase A1
MKSAAVCLALANVVLYSPAAFATDLEQQLVRCSVLGDASARLGCYDELTKAATAATVAGNPEPDVSAAAGAPPPPALVVPAIASASKAPPEAPISRLEQLWETSPAARRGVFAFRSHRENYLLLGNYSSSSNLEPYRDVTPAGVKAKRVELTYQLSLKTKAIEQVAGLPVDIWLAYTQQSFWQAYNRAASSPFRETNYQPEVMAVVPLNADLFGLKLRFVNLGLIHQSNGQTGSLSRSWNRVYSEFGLDKGNFSLGLRVWRRLDNAKSDNDNPDITDFLGQGDLTAMYREGGHEYSVMVRRNFRTDHGAVTLGWAFPLTTNLKGYVQAFSGYGQSLIDYNYSQKSLGFGVNVDF